MRICDCELFDRGFKVLAEGVEIQILSLTLGKMVTTAQQEKIMKSWVPLREKDIHLCLQVTCARVSSFLSTLFLTGLRGWPGAHRE